MFEYFLHQARGWRVLAHIVAPIVWFQTALLMTGVYTAYNASQGVQPMEEMPFFSGEFAATRLDAVMASGHEQTAFVFYGLDLVNAVLIAAGLAAIIGFGLRSIHREGRLARLALLAPLALVCAEFIENGLLATALALPASREALGAAAGIAAGAKFLCFGAAALLALIAAIVGGYTRALHLLRPRQ